MRIVDTDNFCGDYPNERFIATDIENREMAEVMAWALNEDPRFGGPRSRRFYKVVEDDYKLAPPFEP